MDPTTIERIGLVLSGGGFRATLHHLGVVRLLREKGLLSKVSHICSVSGGSITGAHLALNWERYIGTASDFQSAADELVAFTQTDLRGTIVRYFLFSYAALGIPRLISPGGWSRTSICQAKYNRLFNGATLAALRRDDSSSTRPELHLLSTSMTTGDFVSFSCHGLQIESENLAIPIQQDDLPVAMAVAASSAFPPLFAPVPLSRDRVPKLESNHYLTDGGVLDNLGIRKLLWLHDKCGVQFNLAIVSRAERETLDKPGNSYPIIIQRAHRSTELMMERISWFELDSIAQLEEEAGCKIAICQLTDKVDQELSCLPLETQEKVQTIRTDLDAFTDDEVNGLVRHGYSVAKKELFHIADQPSREVTDWWPGGKTHSPPLDLIESHKFRLGLFRSNDWACWALLMLMLIYVGVPAGTIVVYTVNLLRQIEAAERREALREEEQQRRERQERNVVVGVQLVEGLAELLVSNSHQQFDIARKKWEEDVKQHRADPQVGSFYARLFDESGQQMQDVVSGLRVISERLKVKQLNQSVVDVLTDQQFKAIVLRFSNSIRNRLLDADKDDPGYHDILKDYRRQWYQETIAVTSEIIRWRENGASPEDVTVSRNRFRVHYWGLLGLVEEADVESAMIYFGRRLEGWEGTNPDPSVGSRESMTIAKETLDYSLFSEDKPEADIRPRRLQYPSASTAPP